MDKTLILKMLEVEFIDNDMFKKRFAFLEGCDSINRLSRKYWDNITAELSLKQVVQLIKILTLSEMYFKWSGGSVSSVIWIFKELERRDMQLSREIADWVLSHTDNIYLPFGTNNYYSKSLSEYYNNQRQTSFRRSERIKQEEEKQQLYKNKLC